MHLIIFFPVYTMGSKGDFVVRRDNRMKEELAGEKKHIFRGEAALLFAVLINSFGVILMLYSRSGISAISSVPYAFSEVLPSLSLGTWTYIFQGVLVLSLMILRKRFVLLYVFSFAVGFVFGEMLDVHELWIHVLPDAAQWRILYFLASYFLICLGVALSNRCGLPIVPTDLFPREFAKIMNVGYPAVKISFDILCLTVTVGMTGLFLGRLQGIGIGTVLAALTMGKTIGGIGSWLDKRMEFVSLAMEKNQKLYNFSSDRQ